MSLLASLPGPSLFGWFLFAGSSPQHKSENKKKIKRHEPWNQTAKHRVPLCSGFWVVPMPPLPWVLTWASMPGVTSAQKLPVITELTWKNSRYWQIVWKRSSHASIFLTTSFFEIHGVSAFLLCMYRVCVTREMSRKVLNYFFHIFSFFLTWLQRRVFVTRRRFFGTLIR